MIYVLIFRKSEDTVNRLKSYEDFENETKFNILDAVIDQIIQVCQNNSLYYFKFL